MAAEVANPHRLTGTSGLDAIGALAVSTMVTSTAVPLARQAVIVHVELR